MNLLLKVPGELKSTSFSEIFEVLKIRFFRILYLSAIFGLKIESVKV